MQLELSGSSTYNNLRLTVEEALSLQEQLAKTINFAMKHKSGVISLPTVITLREKNIPASLNILVEA